MHSNRKKEEDLIKPEKEHRPYFIILATVVETSLVIYEIIYNKGIEPWSDNPWLGPSLETLVDLGGKFVPDILNGQWWRFVSPIFLHAGILHLLMNMIMQVRVGPSLEKAFGTVRIAIIYMLSGIFGNISSSIFLPTEVEIGASGALFGFIGVLLCDLIRNWSLLQSPFKNLIMLIITILISFAIGLLPGIDNFCHLGGFVMGILTGFILIPNLSYGKCQTRFRLCTMCVLIPTVIAVFVGSLALFYSQVNTYQWCHWCADIACIPVFSWCTSNGISLP